MAGLVLCALSTSCWKEEHGSASPNRYRVQNLVGIPGDGEVILSWTQMEGVSAQDYLVKYLDADNNTIKMHTEGATSCAIMGLVNGYKYSFGVQAIYDGGVYSGISSVDITPTTERLAIKDLVSTPSDMSVTLSWTAPSSSVMYYKVTYYKTGEEDNVSSIIVDGKATEVYIGNLTNDVNYIFTVVPHYAKGDAEASQLKEMPAFAVPFTFEPAHPASGMPVKFKFNIEAYTTATDIVWTLPDNTKLNGVEAEASFVIGNTETDSNAPQTFNVELTAKVGGADKKWTVEVPVTPFLFFKTDWEWDTVKGQAQGFKGSTPVLSADGKTVYVITCWSPLGVYAVDAVTGEEKWRYIPDPVTDGYNGCTVNPVTGDIYFGSSSSGITALNANGAQLWKNTKVGVLKYGAFPAVSKDGNVVYVVDTAGNVFAINASTGSEIWKAGVAPMAKGGSGIYVNGDEIIVICDKADASVNFLKASDGSKVCEPISVGHAPSEGGGMAVSPDKKYGYIGTADGYVIAVDIESHKKLSEIAVPDDNATDTNPATLWGLCVSPTGKIFGGTKRGTTFILTFNGSSLSMIYDGTGCPSWGVANAFNYAHPCCDAEGNFYATTGGAKNQNYRFDPSGKITAQWSVLTSANQRSMAGNGYHNGVLYSILVGAKGDNGALVAKYVGGEDATTGWPCNGGNICGSCCIK